MSTTIMTSSDEKKAQDVSDDEHKTVDVELADFGFTKDMYGEDESGVDPAYQAKARRLNEAFQEIGMGKYQVCLCVTVAHRSGGVFLDLGRFEIVVSVPRSSSPMYDAAFSGMWKTPIYCIGKTNTVNPGYCSLESIFHARITR